MNYFEILSGVISGNDSVFRLATDGKARNPAMFNIVILGIVFGLSNYVGLRSQGAELPSEGIYLLLTPLLLSVLGIVTMCGAVMGLCLVYWAAAKAFGGPAGFGQVLDLVGMSAVPFWLLAPLLNYAIQFTPNQEVPLILMLLIVLAFFWSFVILRRSLVVGQGLSVGKATLVVAGMWIFSLSAIYLFLP
jgi:hypothetical protein